MITDIMSATVLFVCAAVLQASERDLFVVQIGGFDTHSDLGDDLAEKFTVINTALTSFVNEMKRPSVNMWNSVTIVSAKALWTVSWANHLAIDSDLYRFCCLTRHVYRLLSQTSAALSRPTVSGRIT